MDVLSKSNWRRAGDSGMHAHAASLRRSRALRAALDNAYALPQLRTLSGSNPLLPPKRKKDARVDVLSKSNWRRAGDSNPRCPFGAYSLSRRAPSASRSALRNSRNIIPYSAPTVQEKKCKSSEFPCRYTAHHAQSTAKTCSARLNRHCRVHATSDRRSACPRRRSHYRPAELPNRQ